MSHTTLRSFVWDDDGVSILDQRALPSTTTWLSCSPTAAGLEDAAVAIETLAVRGAPAIGGVAGAAVGMMAVASAARTGAALHDELAPIVARLRRTRPTAVNLFVALDAVAAAAAAHRDHDVDVARAAVVAAARADIDDDVAACAAMGEAGAALVEDGDVVVTICHTGALATCGQGTALGVVKSARAQGKDVAVVALETRPLLQGARLTAWECLQEGIPVTLITDGMAAFALSRGIFGGRRIRRAFVGADRIATNGDTANKIGTYGLAVACAAHDVPFHVVAPRSTFDDATADGAAIPIEERHADEVRQARGTPLSPTTVPVWNPAFDVTPARLIRSWISERGVHVVDDGRLC